LTISDPNSESVLKTIDVFQLLIARMSASSSTVKNWCITIVTAIIIFSVDKGEWKYLLVALVPILVFAALDIYYLAVEKRIRSQYDAFVGKIHNSNAIVNDLFNVGDTSIDMATTIAASRSYAVWPFYLLQLIALVGIGLAMGGT